MTISREERSRRERYERLEKRRANPVDKTARDFERDHDRPAEPVVILED